MYTEVLEPHFESNRLVCEKAKMADLITCMLSHNYELKPLHTIGKVSVNPSILYKNQEI